MASLGALAGLYASVLLGAAALFSQLEGWSFVDSAYYAAVTMQTIGFGDMYPTSQLGRAVNLVFMVLGPAIAGVLVVQVAFLTLRAFRERVSPLPRFLRQNRNAAALFLGAAYVLGGSLVFSALERLSMFDALHLTLSMVVTIGYGDIAPRTVAGRAFTVPYAFFANGVVGVALEAVGRFVFETVTSERPKSD